MSDTILLSKFYKPAVPSDNVRRSLLMYQIGKDKRFILISAPSGYGKSTLVSSWLDIIDETYTWLNLSETDNSLIKFLKYLSIGIKRKYPGFGNEILPLLTTSGSVENEILINTFVNEIINYNSSILIVLDDYHLISEDAIHNLLTKILNFPIPGFRLVLITRSDLPLPIVEWRGKDFFIEPAKYINF